MVYGVLGRYPLFVITYIKCIKFWLRLTQLPDNRIAKQAYLMILQQQERGKVNWAFEVKNVLLTNGFGFVWMMQGVGNSSLFLKEFKDRLICCYKQNWHAKLVDNDRFFNKDKKRFI